VRIRCADHSLDTGRCSFFVFCFRIKSVVFLQIYLQSSPTATDNAWAKPKLSTCRSATLTSNTHVCYECLYQNMDCMYLRAVRWMTLGDEKRHVLYTVWFFTYQKDNRHVNKTPLDNVILIQVRGVYWPCRSSGFPQWWLGFERGQVFPECFGSPCHSFIPLVAAQSSTSIIQGWCNMSMNRLSNSGLRSAPAPQIKKGKLISVFSTRPLPPDLYYSRPLPGYQPRSNPPTFRIPPWGNNVKLWRPQKPRQRGRYSKRPQAGRVRIPVMSKMFTSPYHLDRLWGPPRLVSNGY
jgi:hypothetical protein